MNRNVAIVLILGSAVSLWAAGCSDDAALPATPTPEPAIPAEPAERTPTKAVVKGPPLADLAKQIDAFATKIRASEPAALKKAIAATANDAVVMRALYAKPVLRFYAPDGNLTQDGAAVMQLLTNLDRHGVDRRGYRLSETDAATDKVVKAFAAQRAAAIALGESPKVAQVAIAICDWVRTGEGGEIALVRAGGDKLDGAARKRIGAKLTALMKTAAAARAAMLAADLEIARAVIRYVVDFKFAKVAHPYDAMTPSTVRGLARKKAKEITAILVNSEQRTAEVLKGLWPTHPQYKQLLGAVDQYREFASKGGWEKLAKLPRKKLDKGYRGPWIAKLRKRLASEGYQVPAGDDELYDSDLVDVVMDFQARHQQQEDGTVGKGLLKELNVPVDKRLRELGLALQRLREAQARDPEEFFFWVNISSQIVQVYDNGKVVREHRVIVGKDNEDIDFAAKIKGKINRTKMFSATMTKVTLAPRWYPTQRVIDIELGPALARDPDYYEKEGYVSEMRADGSETVYQKSGPTNLLGRVKFQFPNKHSIYMHDTPGRSIFKRPRRAYSHGCIRLHHPMKMAYFVLGRDHRKWTKKTINKVVDEREEKLVMLKKKLPVHIDYVSATVGKGAKVHFWSDVYAYDLAYFTGQLPVEDTEEYEPKTFKGIR